MFDFFDFYDSMNSMVHLEKIKNEGQKKKIFADQIILIEIINMYKDNMLIIIRFGKQIVSHCDKLSIVANCEQKF